MTKSITTRLGDLDEKDKKEAITILDTATHVLGACILADQKPGHMCSLGVLLIEYALIHSNYKIDDALEVVDEAAEHIKRAIRDQESAISPESVIKRMKKLAEEEEETNDGPYKH